MDANTVAAAKLGNLRSKTFDDSGDFVAEGQRKRVNRRPSRAIMGIGVANTGCFNAHKDIARADLGLRDILELQRA
jgi:hypothetical protein